MFGPKNEYKFSVLRNFGSEQFSFTATIYSRSTKIARIAKQVTAETQQLIFDTWKATSDRADKETEAVREKFKDQPEVLRQINKLNKK